MSDSITRREAIRSLGVGAAGIALGTGRANGDDARPAQRLGVGEIALSAVTPHTIRVTLLREPGRSAVATDGSLLSGASLRPTVRIPAGESRRVACGGFNVVTDGDASTLRVILQPSGDPAPVQTLTLDRATEALTFRIGAEPVFGLGEGGAQFDRRGALDRMISGSDGYELRTHGSRVPIPWLIGTSGWAMLLHQPQGTFDLRTADGVFTPTTRDPALAIDAFVTASTDPTTLMREYALLTGFPEMPPLWSLGYQQSHRTLASREEILDVARKFREKKLPCDALIYLGTGFAPVGWNDANGSFEFNPTVFPDPVRMLDELHSEHFRVVLHAVILSRSLKGRARDACNVSRFDESAAGCYWDMHRKVAAQGADAWWPDEGDDLDAASRLTRNRMYWEGPQIDEPQERPYALHRNGYAGMQRYASFLWSGDVDSRWETLRTQIPIAINTALSGIPYWGTDTGGFVTTKELTGELYARWFQFSAFCPLFRSHGRTWRLHLPWAWNEGSVVPDDPSHASAAMLPDPAELHNAEIEPICRKFLELRYRLLPYLYSAVHEAHMTGVPIIRALWLHHPDDPECVARGDEYLWGRDILVAPVVEKGATSREVYLPQGDWYDMWTEQHIAGARSIVRDVDLSTMPIYVRAGAIVPFGPVKQYTDERVDLPVELVVYPGADGAFTLYEDDGITFGYRRGAYLETHFTWSDATATLSARESGWRGAAASNAVAGRFRVRLAGSTEHEEMSLHDGRATLALG